MNAPATNARSRFVDIHMPGWLAARRYGMPAAMLEQATRRRLAGDWRGACAAARVDVTFELDRVGDRYGQRTAAQLGDDLVHLVPDLVRWHAPRHLHGETGLLAPKVRMTLATYDDGVCLSMRTPAHLERPQRLTLHCGPSTGGEDWTEARYLWDERHTARLLTRLGGGDRTPFFDRAGKPRPAQDGADGPTELMEQVLLLADRGEAEAAWRLAGVQADFTLATSRWPSSGAILFPDTLGAMVPAVLDPARRLLDSAELVVLATRGRWGPTQVALTRQDGSLTARRFEPRYDDARPAVPTVHWQRFPDLELLRHGRLAAAQLHPLVRAAMFPEQPDPGYQPDVPEEQPHDMPSGRPRDVPVRCRGAWHRLTLDAGGLSAADHPADEIAREQALASLGGSLPPCVATLSAWQTGAGRLPRPLRELRSATLTAIAHGSTQALVALLATGTGLSGVRDRWGRGPLHLLSKVDDPLALLDALLSAGLPVDERDKKGRTPLGCMLFDGAPAPLVRAMLDAGADPRALDEGSDTLLHLLRSRDAAQIVPWLTAAGVSLEAVDDYGRTPLLTQVIADAPAEALRAMLDAGADPAAGSTYTDENVLNFIDYAGRDDLDFLVDAARAAGITQPA